MSDDNVFQLFGGGRVPPPASGSGPDISGPPVTLAQVDAARAEYERLYEIYNCQQLAPAPFEAVAELQAKKLVQAIELINQLNTCAGHIKFAGRVAMKKIHEREDLK